VNPLEIGEGIQTEKQFAVARPSSVWVGNIVPSIFNPVNHMQHHFLKGLI
jgi:hypothetical protein